MFGNYLFSLVFAFFSLVSFAGTKDDVTKALAGTTWKGRLLDAERKITPIAIEVNFERILGSNALSTYEISGTGNDQGSKKLSWQVFKEATNNTFYVEMTFYDSRLKSRELLKAKLPINQQNFHIFPTQSEQAIFKENYISTTADFPRSQFDWIGGLHIGGFVLTYSPEA
ncbi:MAG: hypothetical protein H6731_10990 [Myxococcales bacterium]|nr:MAG: hypothetical protein H6731_10990 [Myxococcales bacterium]